MVTVILIVFIAIWVLGMPVAWGKFGKWDCTKGERVWYTIIWPIAAILYSIHLIHNK